MGLQLPRKPTRLEPTVRIYFLALCLGAVAAGIARVLASLIALVTNLSFFGNVSLEGTAPGANSLGLWVIPIPVVGGIIVGCMARWGSPAIRGHGIPEAMEQVLLNRSRIAARLTWLKPASAAIAIGTGGPFGAEGPIIATGGALGSVLGQLIPATGNERKVLLASGAAAGMAATFGTPVSAVLLAVELLLFEFRARSMLPVALAAVAATGIRYFWIGDAPAFAVPSLAFPSGPALMAYLGLGCIVGAIASAVTWVVYAVEDAFEHLPIHWMWWPALGGLAVGVLGYFSPKVLGVGYDNIEAIASGSITGAALALFVACKFTAWAIALGSGTSGGTLAPLFTIGGGVGSLLAAGLIAVAPGLGVDIRMAALVGMAALFAGASRAFLASAVFAFEATHEMSALLPLLGGCACAVGVSRALSVNTIMTEKLARRGTRVPADYMSDFFDQIPVTKLSTRTVQTLKTDQTVSEVRGWLHSGTPESSHQGYVIVDNQSKIAGVLTRRDILDPKHAAGATLRSLVVREPVVIQSDASMRDAMVTLAHHSIGRLPVVDSHNPERLVGIVTRSDIIAAESQRLAEDLTNPTANGQ